jgi:hypothetical protein
VLHIPTCRPNFLNYIMNYAGILSFEMGRCLETVLRYSLPQHVWVCRVCCQL